LTITRKTDHSYFEEKLKIRLDNLPKANPLKVLDMFSGNGLIWEEIQRRTKREILVLRIDREVNKCGIYLMGENLKFNLNYGEFDVIDLDTYGVPFRQMEKIFDCPSKPKVLFITFIQSVWGVLPAKMLNTLGYTNKMIKKIPTLFYRYGQEKFLQYLSLKRVKNCRISHTPDKRKNYIIIEFH